MGYVLRRPCPALSTGVQNGTVPKVQFERWGPLRKRNGNGLVGRGGVTVLIQLKVPVQYDLKVLVQYDLNELAE